MVAAKTSMGERSCLCRFVIEMGLPSRMGGFVRVRMARRARIEMAIMARRRMDARNMSGARGMRERSLLEVGDSLRSVGTFLDGGRTWRD